jgi:hypothetical protein
MMLSSHCNYSAALVERDAVASELRDVEQRLLETNHDTAGDGDGDGNGGNDAL